MAIYHLSAANQSKVARFLGIQAPQLASRRCRAHAIRSWPHGDLNGASPEGRRRWTRGAAVSRSSSPTTPRWEWCVAAIYAEVAQPRFRNSCTRRATRPSIAWPRRDPKARPRDGEEDAARHVGRPGRGGGPDRQQPGVRRRGRLRREHRVGWVHVVPV
ncbi:hypothetical protein ZWY2020_042183 [Hordeum vulgare]|nr:hypothetical protein ZWY2020_042183 [Hordeum vulgare]